MMASAAYAGEFTTEEILAKRDAAGITVAEALASIGYGEGEAVGGQPIGAFVELHIEQGPILEAEGKTIGVVEGGQGIAWFDGTVEGFESHAGTTPMPRRRDALLGLFGIRSRGGAHRPRPRAERRGDHRRDDHPVAVAERGAGPDRLHHRHTRSALLRLDAMEAEIREAAAEIGERRKLTIGLDRIWRKEPVPFDPKVVAAVDSAAESLGLSRRRIISARDTMPATSPRGCRAR